jgi:murein tripeptide amidase MpaA
VIRRESASSFAIDDDLDGGAIEVVRASSPRAVELLLRPDTASSTFMQWFHFRARGVGGARCRYRIANAGEATYADAFEGYRVCASHDGEAWFRVPTRFDGRALTFQHTPSEDEVRYAYFATYPAARRARLLDRVEAAPRTRVERVGETIEGRPLDVLIIGDERPDQRRIWITARQHPGETAAEWFAEGALGRLLDEEDPVVAELLERAVFYVVASMNPDGGVLGNQRTNAAGRDLNRAWIEPDPALCPEVFLVRRAMLDAGVDLFLDIHADERTPHCFAAGCEGNPGYGARLDRLEDLFMDALIAANQDFQREQGYDPDPPGEGDLSTAGNWVGERFDCLSLTLEMPFKDEANHPDPLQGWSPERADRLGRSALDSVLCCLDDLR